MEWSVQEAVGLIDQDPFSDIYVPPELEENIQGHRAHLVQLVRRMQTAGISADQIEESVSLIITSYKAELIRTITTIMR